MFGRIKQTLWGALFGCLITTQALGQTATLLPNAKQQFFTAQGIPAASGTVDFYIPSTTTRKTTWKSSTESTGNQNTNPVLLDAGGFATIYGDGSYRQVVKDVDGNTIWDAVTTSTGSGGGGGGTSIGDGDAVGTIKPWAGITAPNQYMFTYGQALSRTTYSALFTAITQSQSVICTSGLNVLSGIADTSQLPIGGKVEASCIAPGTTIVSKASTSVTVSANASISTAITATFFLYGDGDGSTTFNLPDSRGQTIVGRNNMGGTASANLNSTYYGTVPDATGAAGGAQSTVMLLANLPPYTPSGTNGSTTSSGLFLQGGVSDNFTSVAGTGQFDNLTKANVVAPGATFTGTPQGGTSTPFSRVMPSLTLNYIIKVTPDASSGIPFVGDITIDGSLTATGGMSVTNSAAVQYYVSTTGNDGNNCTATGSPCLTIQAAWNKAAIVNYGSGGFQINLADGSYSQGLLATQTWGGSGPQLIVGNCTTPGNVVVTSTSTDGTFTAHSNTEISIKCLEVQSSVQHGFYSKWSGIIHFDKIRFGTAVNGQLTTSYGGIIVADADGATCSYSIVGAAARHIYAHNGAIRTESCTVTISGTPAFSSAFATTTGAGHFNYFGTTYSGSATGIRFDASDNSSIQGDQNLTFLPGDASGVVRSGGNYFGSVVLTSGDPNSSPWIAYTPTITAGTGSPSVAGVPTGLYKQIGKTLIVQIRYVSSSNVSGASGQLKATLPLTADTFGYSGSSYESAITGIAGGAYIVGGAPTIVQAAKYDGTTWWVNSYTININVTYQLP